MDQDDKDGKRERNDRVIVIPSWHDRLGELERATELPSALRAIWLSGLLFETSSSWERVVARLPQSPSKI
jgi:hypothetical protein